MMKSDAVQKILHATDTVLNFHMDWNMVSDSLIWWEYRRKPASKMWSKNAQLG